MHTGDGYVFFFFWGGGCLDECCMRPHMGPFVFVSLLPLSRIRLKYSWAAGIICIRLLLLLVLSHLVLKFSTQQHQPGSIYNLSRSDYSLQSHFYMEAT